MYYIINMLLYYSIMPMVFTLNITFVSPLYYNNKYISIISNITTQYDKCLNEICNKQMVNDNNSNLYVILSNNSTCMILFCNGNVKKCTINKSYPYIINELDINISLLLIIFIFVCVLILSICYSITYPLRLNNPL